MISGAILNSRHRATVQAQLCAALRSCSESLCGCREHGGFLLNIFAPCGVIDPHEDIKTRSCISDGTVTEKSAFT